LPYEVSVGVFEGPIDLLLHLITRRRVDIYEVSIADITEEYVTALREAESLDLEVTTGFLVVAATLLELKSARLLPASAAGDADPRVLEERDLLLARLVECATYREAGAHLGGCLTRGAAFFGRTAAVEPPFVGLVPDLLARVSVDRLAAAAGALLTPKPEVELDTSHLAPIRVSVQDAIVEMADALERGRRATFARLCGGKTERIEVVVRFVALLELYKVGAVDLEQGERFGDIVATWTGEAGIGDALEDAEEYGAEKERAR
jgi:segregation and condensation protein A